MNNEILKLDNVSLSYDKKKTYVLKDISFGVYSGEILSIIGLNGAGKSTLLKIIAGIIKPTSGKILKNCSFISYVPQKNYIDKTFPVKVYEFIKIYNPKTNDEEIISYLEKFNSKDLFEKNISNLSGGEFQKVLIISSIISKPDLLLLDEPTAGIDIVGEENFYELIKEVKEIFPMISIILVSHNIKLVYKNSDKVICLHENNFCCHGTPVEINKNKVMEMVFGKYTLPYKHNPHDKIPEEII